MCSVCNTHQVAIFDCSPVLVFNKRCLFSWQFRAVSQTKVLACDTDPWAEVLIEQSICYLNVETQQHTAHPISYSWCNTKLGPGAHPIGSLWCNAKLGPGGVSTTAPACGISLQTVRLKSGNSFLAYLTWPFVLLCSMCLKPCLRLFFKKPFLWTWVNGRF